jgi:hypothetical protein
VRFLDWLAAHDLTLTSCTQGDLDLWLTTGPRSRYDVHHFIEWTSDRKLSTTLNVPPVRSRPGDALDAETRWAIIAKLLHGPDIDLADRVAGSFVLLYAQPLSRIAMMTTKAVTVTDTDITVRFGTQVVVVPDPLATHLATLITTGRAHHIGIGSTTPSRWLFPGHLPGRPITAIRLGQRLSIHGIDARAARRAAQQPSPHKSPQSCSPRYSASPSPQPSNGSTPPEATGPTTPPPPPPILTHPESPPDATPTDTTGGIRQG